MAKTSAAAGRSVVRASPERDQSYFLFGRPARCAASIAPLKIVGGAVTV